MVEKLSGDELISRWQDRMHLFVREGLGIDGKNGYVMSRQQEHACREISKLVYCKRKKNVWKQPLSPEEEEYAAKIGISIMSGQGPGKDAWAAWLYIWLIYMFREVLIPCTAPGEDQLKNILWPEVSRWLNKRGTDNEYLALEDIRKKIVVQATRIYHADYNGKANFGFMKTANTKDDPEAQAKTLYGLHEKYMAILVEEAAGVPEPVFKPLEGTLTRECNFVVLIFNPIFRTGYAIESQTGPFAHKYITLRWDAEESEIVTKQHILDMEEKYGRDSNTFRTLVKGLPPKAEEDTIIPYDWVMEAVNRPIEPDDTEPRIGGLDPGAGGDNSVLRIRHGHKVLNTKYIKSTPNSIEVGDWAAGIAIKEDLDALCVDVIGIGNGAYFQAKKVLRGVRNTYGREIVVYPVDVRSTAKDEDKYPNVRSELMFRARDLFQEKTISIPDNQMLKEELWSPKRRPNARKEEAESKLDIKKRLMLGRSPNDADAFYLTLFVNDNIFRRRKKSADEDFPHIAAWQIPKQSRYGWMRV